MLQLGLTAIWRAGFEVVTGHLATNQPGDSQLGDKFWTTGRLILVNWATQHIPYTD